MYKQTCRTGVLVGLVFGIGVVGCNSTDGPPGIGDTTVGAVPTGGVVATGGSEITGGLLATGGAESTGGILATGGMTATGGAVVTGGAIATGGMTVETDDGGTEALPPLPEAKTLPIVFVHGFAGSAQQFHSQAMRFVANGYPQERLFAYDHDGAGFDFAGFANGVDAVVDEARSKFGVDQVFLAGHSRGTTVSSNYLGNRARAAKVAKYVSLDGSGCRGVSIDCLELDKAGLGGQTHVEVATSGEAFAEMYEFYLGEAPKVVDVVRQPSPVTISGRAVDFPANTGKSGATLNIFEVDADTGHRVGDAVATYDIGADGNFGPLQVDPRKYYECTLTTDTSDHHFYMQRFLRDSPFIRLLSGPPDSGTRVNTNRGPSHAAVIMTRMREWKTEDILNIGTTSPSRGDEPETNVISSATGNDNIAIHLHDDTGSPGNSSLDLLGFFATQPFQTGVDFYMPASDPPDGTITFTSMPRGDTARPQVLHTPNWASDGHIMTVMFADFPHPGD